MWKGLGMMLQYQIQGTHTHRILAESPKNAATWYTKRPSYNYKQYRITQDQVSVSTNYMIWTNWWIWNKAHTIGAIFTFSYRPGWFPTVPHDGYISISSGQAACLLWFGASLLKTTLQGYFQREHRKQHPAHKSMVPWHAYFIATECMVSHHSSQCLTSVSKATVTCVGKVHAGSKKVH
jgi:hypothetical protein